MNIGRQFASIAVAGFMAWSASASADTNTTMQTQQIENTVREFILKNPQVLVQSLQNYQAKQAEETQKTFLKIQEMAPKYADKIFRETTDPVAGNPKGTVTLVEFSDYQCSHCISMNTIVDNLIKQNPNLRVVLKEFPIRGPLSETAAKAALAAQKQGKYYEFRFALMKNASGLTEDGIYKIAQSVGLDVSKLKTDMKSDAVSQQIKNNYKLAENLKLIYTPVFFIAKTNLSTSANPNEIIFIPGGIDQEQLNKAISKMSS